ncbi:adenylate/guanylate cyclase domain-containing protein [Patulibacter defluvii]|uniref:adenylate/guanylate cyclase domain-containing protein n=1 Tax=Patulibacter defluvii TaxID=3095358 RepID=UPI002A765FF6|nr:adenylate/guanylate cyclase domain-containing protein [Patulibacter sp. DM4]
MRVDRCFAFLDLCGFSGYTDANGDEEAVAVLALMRSVVRRAAERRGVRVTKWLGDGVMLSCIDQDALTAATLEIRHHLGGASPLAVRGGICRGPVIMFEGDDYVGAAINVAARLCDVAAAGQLLVAAAERQSLPQWASLATLGPVAIAGVARPVVVQELDLWTGDSGRTVIDPVCGLSIPAEAAIAPHDEDDPALRCFCSADCAAHFARVDDHHGPISDIHRVPIDGLTTGVVESPVARRGTR